VKKRALLALAMLAVLVMATGCSRVAIIPQNELHMGGSFFKETKASIKAGQVVKFIDDADGATHILVVGSGGKYQPMPGAPAQLVVTATTQGMQINAGQEIDVTFAQAGTYTITCTIHPAMLATITVT
jgi:plastocyanin